MKLGDRGATPVIGNLLLIGIAVVVGVVVTVSVLPLAEDVDAPPPQAAIEIEERIVDRPGVQECPGISGERALEVTLTQLERADRIYVIVHDEGGERKKVVWSDPSEGQVGTTRLLINDVEYEPHWADIGEYGGSDIAFCPDETATFRFYGEYEDETFLIRKFTAD